MTSPGEKQTRLGHVIVESMRTQRSLVEAELGEARKATNVNDLHSALWGAAGRLHSLGHYDAVDVVMQLPPDASSADVIDAYFTVKEKPVPTLTVGSYVKESGVVLETSGKLRTPFGYGETVDMSFSKADNGAYTTGLGLTVPHVHPRVKNASVHARDDIVSHEWHSSFVSKVQSLTLAALGRGNKHSAEVILERRDEVPKLHPSVPFAADASSTIVSMLRPSTKVGLKYTYTDDTRDSVAAPSQGKLVQGSTELALPPGSACFVKSTLRGEYHKMIGPKMFGRTGLTWSTGGAFGCLLPYNTKGMDRSYVSDRFFVGGPLNVRGFDMHGVGPRAVRGQGGAAGGDALGGEVMYSLTSMLSAPVPFESLANNGFRAIAFANVGSLMAESRKFEINDSWKKLRASIGCGLLVDVGAARVEITYSTPIRSAPHDVWRHFQLGIGISLG